MSKLLIEKVEGILLSAPYATQNNDEVRWHLPSGYRTCGFVRLTLSDGRTGLGEGYIAVFAPHIFEEIVRFLSSHVLGRSIEDRKKIIDDLNVLTGYWSRQGAARHVLSAFDIALFDLAAQVAEKPLYLFLNPRADGELDLYASGGDSPNPFFMSKELDEVEKHGIKTFKIRARNDDTAKTLWTMEEASNRGIRIAIDMTQNLVVPSQSIGEILTFRQSLSESPAFLEEPLGPDRILEYPFLRKWYDGLVAGGEIITHPDEMVRAIENGSYDIAQPDATVIGGISALKMIFGSTADKELKTSIYVHCWGGPVGMAANYHAAAAWGGQIAEWPLPSFPLRDQMPVQPWCINKGRLILSQCPGLGISLDHDVLNRFPFREEAVYSCLPNKKTLSMDEKEQIWSR